MKLALVLLLDINIYIFYRKLNDHKFDENGELCICEVSNVCVSTGWFTLDLGLWRISVLAVL